MDVYALDSKFNLMSVGIPYGNLQWNRRYYEAGDFQMEVPLTVFDPSWAYIGTDDRPELGMVQQVQTLADSPQSVLVGGFFCEKMLDDKVVYPRYKGDVSKTEQAVRTIFDRYRSDLPIRLGAANDPLLGDRTQSDFSDDQLGDKIYRMLESRELSYRIRYDYADNRLTFEVWQGVDRTQSQSANPFQTFSMEFGNLLTRTVDMDDSDYKNYAIIPVDADDSGKERTHYVIDWSNGGYKKTVVYDKRSEHPDEGEKDDNGNVTGAETEAQFKARVIEECTEQLRNRAKVEDVNITAADTGEYMRDYDLGDKCDVLLTDLGITMETRVVEVNEVFKAEDGHTVTVGLGNKRISNTWRAVHS